MYRNFDAPALPQAVRIAWEMVTESDDRNERPDSNDEGFWPSLDPDEPGFIGGPAPDDLDGSRQRAEWERQHAEAEQRLADWEAGVWEYVGVIARAHISIPIGGGAFCCYRLDSPGLWGIESDSGDYLATVYEEQKEELRAHLQTLARSFIQPDPITESEK